MSLRDVKKHDVIRERSVARFIKREKRKGKRKNQEQIDWLLFFHFTFTFQTVGLISARGHNVPANCEEAVTRCI